MKNSTTRQGDPAQIGWTVGRAPLWLRGIRLAEGEGGATPPAPAAPPAPQAPTPPAAPAAPAPSPALFGQQPPPQAQPTPPTFSQEYVHELREEAKTTRIAHQELEAKHQAAETARQEAETKLAEAQAELAKFTREKAISSAAAGIANPALLLDSASFLQAIAEVSLDDPEAVKAAITTFVEQNSAYKPTPTLPGNSGPAPLGGSGQKPNTLEGAIGARLSG